MKTKASIVTALKKIIAKDDSLDIDDATLDALCEWLHNSYEWEDAAKLYQHDWPASLKKVSGPTYRGEPFRPQDKKDLEKNTLETAGISWTTDKAVATEFAKQHDSNYGMVITYKPKPNEIGLNVDLLLAIPAIAAKVKNRNCTVYPEQEILLNRNIHITKDMIELIHVEENEVED